jgi:hypothetical protein
MMPIIGIILGSTIFTPHSDRTMTKFLTLALSTTVLFACGTAPNVSLAQDGDQAGNVKTYGAPITADGALSMDEFVKRMADADSLAGKVECEIVASCAMKGCWMDVKLPDGQLMKVKFKDYAFFVPKQGLEGKHAVLQGYALKEVTDVPTLRHYAEDAGKTREEIDLITEPEESLFFLADGVLITF